MQVAIDTNGAENRISLPPGMTLDGAISALSAQKELETYGEKDITVEEVINRFPFEAALALSKAADELHGATIQHDIYLPMGGVIEAKLIGVPISVDKSIQVPWGPFHLPDVEGKMETVQVIENGMVVMKLVARVKRKYQERVQQLAARTRELAQAESIYRGKAIKVRFRNEKGELDVVPPTFMDLSSAHKVIFSEQVQREIAINLFVPIRQAERARKLKIPGKRGILLQGTYGSGKTLTAYMMAHEATSVGRTFIYVTDATELPDALHFAASYAPSLVFAEDIDRVTFGNRTSEMDRLLNTVDGVDTKNVDVITVLTTNNLDLIHPAFLREGRMDKIIKIDEPDAQAAEALIRLFGDSLISAEENLSGISRRLAHKTPAFIREVVENSKLELLLNANGNGDGDLKLTAKDIEIAFFRHEKEREGVASAVRESDMIRQVMDELTKGGGRARLVVPRGM